MRPEQVVDGVIRDCDVIIYIMDSRAPYPNADVEKKIKQMGKSIIYIVNKIDLVSRQELSKLPKEYLPVSAKKRIGTRALRIKLALLAKKPINVGVIGYANVGKSTIINVLAGRASTGVSPIPGFTKSAQWIRLTSRIKLMDSPGLIPQKESQQALALKCSYSINKLKDAEGAALELLSRLKGSLILKKTYAVEVVDDSYDQLELLAKHWHMLLKGGVLDLDRASRKLLKDWQEGKIKI